MEKESGDLCKDLKSLDMEKEEAKPVEEKEVFFKPIDGESSVAQVTSVESYCVNCENNGITKFLLTEIPYFKEVIISSFSCPHCNYKNNEIQSAHQIDKQGIQITLNANNPEDLDRQLIKSDFCSVKIPEVELEIMPRMQRGEITTVEGVLTNIYDGLKQGQTLRQLTDEGAYNKINAFLERFNKLKTLEDSFTLIIRDISGNSFIAPPSSHNPGQKDERLTLKRFDRTTEEDAQLGIGIRGEEEDGGEEDEGTVKDLGAGDAPPQSQEKAEDKLTLTEEVHEFATDCSNCGAPCQTKMKLTPIPNFKEVIVMATDCEKCGVRTNEIKSGSGIESKGKMFTLLVTGPDDLCRDVLKSETCSIRIPELELDVGAGILGGKFTTIEGLLSNLRDQIMGENPLISGDSADTEYKEKMRVFFAKFDRFMTAEDNYTLILDDPAGNSYLQNIYAPDEDPQMKTVEYERSFEQNEELGLNDLNTEDYS